MIVKKENISVSDYQRITSYLYEYNNGIRGENAGFIRVEAKDPQLKISFTLNSGSHLPKLNLYFYYYSHGKMIGILWDEQTEIPRHYEYKETFLLESVFDNNHVLRDMDGILLFSDDSHFYGSEWSDTPLNLRVFEKPEKKTPQLEEYMEALALHEKKEPVIKENKEIPVPKEEPKTYPELLPYPTPDFTSCIKIGLNDLSDFPYIPKELSGNGFLKMQLQHYGHLFLGEKKTSRHHYLGIPGIFTNQRNFVARLFGFPDFITVPHQEQKTGSFGYWVMTISH
jgi:hypothetical protein